MHISDHRFQKPVLIVWKLTARRKLSLISCRIPSHAWQPDFYARLLLGVSAISASVDEQTGTGGPAIPQFSANIRLCKCRLFGRQSRFR